LNITTSIGLVHRLGSGNQKPTTARVIPSLGKKTKKPRSAEEIITTPKFRLGLNPG